jgi:transposase/copper chaperone CopZ
MNDSSHAARHVVTITDMHCDGCAALIDDTLRAVPGVRSVRATRTAGTVEVDLDPRRTEPATVVSVLVDLGFRVRPARVEKLELPVPVEQQVSDAAWLVLEPLLSNGGRRVRDLRRVFDGIAYKHRTGVAWRKVPAEFGPWQTLYARHVRWLADGTWARVATAAVGRPEFAWLEAADSAR